VIIRPAELSDLAAITEIRNFSILNSNALFETAIERPEDRVQWFSGYAEVGKYRILIAEENGRVLGYASSNRYRVGEPFSNTVEFSIFVAQDCGGNGVGSMLYRELIAIARAEKFTVSSPASHCQTRPQLRCTKSSDLRKWASSVNTPQRTTLSQLSLASKTT